MLAPEQTLEVVAAIRRWRGERRRLKRRDRYRPKQRLDWDISWARRTNRIARASAGCEENQSWRWWRVQGVTGCRDAHFCMVCPLDVLGDVSLHAVYEVGMLGGASALAGTVPERRSCPLLARVLKAEPKYAQPRPLVALKRGWPRY